MKHTTFKRLTACLAASLFTFGSAFGQAYTENFDNIGTLAGSGWVTQNNSVPVGLNPNWAQGDVAVFPAFNGATNAYIFANFQMTTGTNTISAWMITPNRTLRNGDVFTFYTRKPVPNPTDFPDRLEVRMSTNGASTNVGTGAAAVGDFTTLLLSINPTLAVGGYPTAWTQYTITVSGLPAPTSGRIAFRYFVTNGGPSGTNSDFIGIDNVVYTPYVCPAFTMTPGGALTGGTAGSAYSTSLTQTGALGAPTYAITAGALPPGLTLSAAGTISGTPTATGTFNFTATVSDNSGCSGSSAYSITVVCPPNPITLAPPPSLCDNGPSYTLVQGSPGGGTYSGTGVTGADFNPASGTQTITYDYTDPYGCAYSSNYTITVNTAPSVTQDPLTDACDNAGMVALTGGSPAGGTYTGTGVTGSDFDPASGTQSITYTYTDGNGCSDMAVATITVNTAPTVTHDPISAVCDNSGMLPLTGGLPAGGTYSGTGVSGADFDPTSGTQTITYTYTDANGCMNDATTSITVNIAPVVDQSAFTAVCEDAADITLEGGSPSGGIYSGTGVTTGMFDPSSGTQSIIYTYTDANGCSNLDTEIYTVNPLPTVSFTSSTDELCDYDSEIVLSGGMPTGGMYSGNGVSGGTFDPAIAGLGMSTITYMYTDANGCMNMATDAINVDECLSITESNSIDVNVYPNPSNGLFTIAQLNAENIYGIIDLQGRAISFDVNPMENGVTIELQHVPSGVYLLQLNMNGVNTSVRLVKN